MKFHFLDLDFKNGFSVSFLKIKYKNFYGSLFSISKDSYGWIIEFFWFFFVCF